MCSDLCKVHLAPTQPLPAPPNPDRQGGRVARSSVSPSAPANKGVIDLRAMLSDCTPGRISYGLSLSHKCNPWWQQVGCSFTRWSDKWWSLHTHSEHGVSICSPWSKAQQSHAMSTTTIISTNYGNEDETEQGQCQKQHKRLRP